MSEHLRREIENLKKQILSISAMVEQSVVKSVKALEERDDLLAEEVIGDDILIDRKEVEVEEECLKVLALHQPVAGDLRYIIAVLKINNELERVGDLAVNIAERARFLASRERTEVPLDFPLMAEKSREMLRKALDSLVNRDAKQAKSVMVADDEVDKINREMYIEVEAAMNRKPEFIKNYTHLLSCSRHLERIADLATNIAEEVIYMVEGEIVRHHAEDYTG